LAGVLLRERFGVPGGFRVNFFISMAPKALPGAGLGKRISQNLVFKELRYQNLDNKWLKLA
jgi:hypothetical protein